MQPGPLHFERSGDIVWALLASLFVATIVLLILKLPFAPLWAQLLKIPKNYLYAGILVFAALGVYASSASIVDLIFMLGLGVVGFMMRRYEIPLAPVLIAVILGPLAEESLRRALAVSKGDPSILVSSGITIVLYSLMVMAVVFSIVSKIRARKTVDF